MLVTITLVKRDGGFQQLINVKVKPYSTIREIYTEVEKAYPKWKTLLSESVEPIYIDEYKVFNRDNLDYAPVDIYQPTPKRPDFLQILHHYRQVAEGKINDTPYKNWEKRTNSCCCCTDTN
jgi:hypothetical protein